LKVEFAKTAKDKEVALVDSSLQETLREMKAGRTAVVSTIAGEKRLNIIVTTADVQRAHAVDVTEAELNKLVANFRIALTSPTSGRPIDPRPAGQKLHDILVKPIEGDLAGIKADTIVWSLDGSLRYLPMAALCVLLAHFGGSILWVFSTVLLQMEVPDQFRGRVFAAELALVTLTSSISSYLTGAGLDRAGWSPRAMAFWLGMMFCVPGVMWLTMLSRWKESPEGVEVPAAAPSGEEEVLEGRIG
jgi:hypothetical protein